MRESISGHLRGWWRSFLRLFSSAKSAFFFFASQQSSTCKHKKVNFRWTSLSKNYRFLWHLLMLWVFCYRRSFSLSPVFPCFFLKKSISEPSPLRFATSVPNFSPHRNSLSVVFLAGGSLGLSRTAETIPIGNGD